MCTNTYRLFYHYLNDIQIACIKVLAISRESLFFVVIRFIVFLVAANLQTPNNKCFGSKQNTA